MVCLGLEVEGTLCVREPLVQNVVCTSLIGLGKPKAFAGAKY
jgi:hypothetical protein